MTLRLPLLLLAVLTIPVSAQRTKSSGKSENISLRLLAGEVPEGQAKVVLVTADTKSAPLDLSTSALSEPVVVPARSTVLKAADKDDALCTITLPPEGKSFAVLLSPQKPAGYVPFVIRLDDQAFKAGDVFLVNRGAKTVVLKLGASEVVLESGKSMKTRPTNPIDNSYYDISIRERDAAGEKLIASTRWPVDLHLRSYLFFTTDGNGRTTYRAVDEFVEAEGKGKR